MHVVTGVTGNTGAVVADALLAAGERVRVVLRDPAGAEAWRARGAEIALADLGDDGAMAQALRDARAAYLLNPPDYRTPDPIGDARRIADALAAWPRTARTLSCCRRSARIAPMRRACSRRRGFSSSG